MARRDESLDFVFVIYGSRSTYLLSTGEKSGILDLVFVFFLSVRRKKGTPRFGGKLSQIEMDSVLDLAGRTSN